MGINTLASIMDATPLQIIRSEYNKIICDIIINDEPVDYIQIFKQMCDSAGIKDDSGFVAAVGLSRSTYQRVRYAVAQGAKDKTTLLAICAGLKSSFADSARLFCAFNFCFLATMTEAEIYLKILYNLDKLSDDREARIAEINEILKSNKLNEIKCRCE